jgi:hypothetical protein
VLTLNPASLQSYALAGVPDYSNIVLEFDPNSAVNESGKVTPPKLNGVSGGAVWSLGPTYDAEGTGAKLVAVVTERHGGEVRAIVGTRLAVFLAIIWDNYSDLVAFLPHPTSADTRI